MNIQAEFPEPSQHVQHEAVTFLETLRPGGPWVLTAILPDGGGPTITETVTDHAGVLAFIKKHDGMRNIYYSANPTRGPMKSKAAKIDISAIEYIIADCDPESDESTDAAKARYRQRVNEVGLKPTIEVDSGNGLQFLYQLEAPIVLPSPDTPQWQGVVADIEARAKALLTKLGASHGTQNIDRILRLPGTTNLPNKKKREEGRVRCQSKLVATTFTDSPLELFPLPVQDEDGGPSSYDDEDDVGPPHVLVDALPVSAKTKRMIKGSDSDPSTWDRSAREFSVFLAMIGAGRTDAQIAAVMFDVGLPIGDKVREEGRPYLRRQIKKARKTAREQAVERNKADDDVIAKLNKEFAVADVGGKVVILHKKAQFDLKTKDAFKTWLGNKYIEVDGKPKPLSDHWLRHKHRAEVDSIVFAPGRAHCAREYNTWQGWAVEPKAGDCSKILKHVLDNVCRGDALIFQWVIAWFAQMLQDPMNKPGTALVIVGSQGTGKTTLGEYMKRILGPHYVKVSDPRLVSGNFNSHHQSCLMLHSEEAFFAGDHRAAGKIKDYITSDTHFVEFKGIDPIPMANFGRLFATSNSDWAVPAGFEERRMCVLEMGEGAMKNYAYFDAIDKEMKNGGDAALLHHLLNFDLTGSNLREVPRTAALFAQQVSTMTPEESWWLDMLKRGELPGSVGKPGVTPKDELRRLYQDHAKRRGIARTMNETALGIFLNKVVPGLDSTTKHKFNFRNRNVRVPAYVMPSLAECRKNFMAKLAAHANFKWEDEEEDDWTMVDCIGHGDAFF